MVELSPNDGTELLAALRGSDRAAVETALTGWAESVLPMLPLTAGEDEMDGVAMGEKTLRGSRKKRSRDPHLVSALGHRPHHYPHRVHVPRPHGATGRSRVLDRASQDHHLV